MSPSYSTLDSSGVLLVILRKDGIREGGTYEIKASKIQRKESFGRNGAAPYGRASVRLLVDVGSVNGVLGICPIVEYWRGASQYQWFGGHGLHVRFV